MARKKRKAVRGRGERGLGQEMYLPGRDGGETALGNRDA
jgi:hypothetical protein